MKPIQYTQHATDRMAERGVSEAEVESVMNAPAITLPGRLGRAHVMGYPRETDRRGLHVIYNEDANQRWVVSVYWAGERE